MKFTTHKWVLNTMTVPNPSYMNNFYEYKVTNQQIEIGPKLLRNKLCFVFCVSFLLRVHPFSTLCLASSDKEPTLLSTHALCNQIYIYIYIYLYSAKM